MRRNEGKSHKRLLTFHPAHRSLLPEDVGHHISVQVKLWLKLQHVCTLFLASLSQNPAFFIYSISLKEMPPKIVVFGILERRQHLAAGVCSVIM